MRSYEEPKGANTDNLSVEGYVGVSTARAVPSTLPRGSRDFQYCRHLYLLPTKAAVFAATTQTFYTRCRDPQYGPEIGNALPFIGREHPFRTRQSLPLYVVLCGLLAGGLTKLQTREGPLAGGSPVSVRQDIHAGNKRETPGEAGSKQPSDAARCSHYRQYNR